MKSTISTFMSLALWLGLGGYRLFAVNLKTEELYKTYCSACHGAKGEGGVEGTAPPLVNSAWVKGEPERAIKIVLHGVMGKMDVAGKTYNLMMPPQGAVLNDRQIAGILTFIREMNGLPKRDATVDPKTVAKWRAKFQDKETYWKAEELLKDHPLPLEGGLLDNLTRSAYTGEYKQIPDFTALKPAKVEKQTDGVVSLRGYKGEEHFALVWEGNLKTKREGEFSFSLDSDDFSRLYINDKQVVEVKGLGPTGRMKTGKIALHPGDNKLRLEYVEYTGREGLILGVKGPGFAKNTFLTEEKSKTVSRPGAPAHMIVPDGQKAVHFRNFIMGTSSRSFAVGYPGGTNLVFDQELCGLAMLWEGEFFNAAPRWHARGTVKLPPIGRPLYTLQNGHSFPGQTMSFKQMEMDENLYPTFKYRNQQFVINDRPEPIEKGLKRTLQIEAKQDGVLRFSPLGQPVDGLEVISTEGIAPNGLAYELPLKKGANQFTFEYRTL